MVNNAADTLHIDTALLQTWREDGDYDYAREMVQSDSSVSEWILRNIDRLLSAIFGSRTYFDNRTLIWTVISVVLVAAIGYFIYRKRPALFGRSGRQNGTDYEVGEDTIYGIDFAAETEKAMRRQDYREAVRLTYLHCLKDLADGGRINWQPWRTPSDYASEVATQDFRVFSNHFLRVRYGNFEATEELAMEMQRLKADITNGGGHDGKNGSGNAGKGDAQ